MLVTRNKKSTVENNGTKCHNFHKWRSPIMDFTKRIKGKRVSCSILFGFRKRSSKPSNFMMQPYITNKSQRMGEKRTLNKRVVLRATSAITHQKFASVANSRQILGKMPPSLWRENPDISKWIKISRLRWAGHLMRMKEEEIPRRMIALQLGGQRGRGRPRLQWIDGVNGGCEDTVGQRRHINVSGCDITTESFMPYVVTAENSLQNI
ncbi:hypothetical protein C0J52_18101 [Blattella germanica]|nr:hypothetical protein C0J52_18101 [Blattella germanica]